MDTSNTSTTLAGEYLSFRLGAKEYGINIFSVQEIRSYERPTRIESAPDGLVGVLSLRGVIVPIVDMRVVCKVTPEYNIFTVTVIANVDGRILGLVVDSVCDVLELTARLIQPPPQDSSDPLVVGVASVPPERSIALLDVSSLQAFCEGF